MIYLYFLSVLLHILAAMIWVGGQAFMITSFFPAMREPEHRAVARSLLLSAGGRFRVFATASLHLLLLTGLFNLWYKTRFDMQNPVTHAGMTKLLLIIVMIGLSLYHDKVIGKQATAAWEKDPQGPATLALRKKAGLIGRINFFLSLLLVGLGVWIVRPVMG
jgi:uncharacterized membrane protein